MKYSSFIFIPIEIVSIVSINCHIYKSRLSMAFLFILYVFFFLNLTKLQLNNAAQSVVRMKCPIFILRSLSEDYTA